MTYTAIFNSDNSITLRSGEGQKTVRVSADWFRSLRNDYIANRAEFNRNIVRFA